MKKKEIVKVFDSMYEGQKFELMRIKKRKSFCLIEVFSELEEKKLVMRDGESQRVFVTSLGKKVLQMIKDEYFGEIEYKRYIVFICDIMGTNGGFNDAVKSFDKLEQAKKFAEKKYDSAIEVYHIFDCSNREVVLWSE